MNPVMLFGIATTVISTILTLTLRIDGIPCAAIFKMVAATGFLFTALAAGANRSPFGWAIFFGLFCSWFGDFFLIGSGAQFFLAGLVSFFLGHMSYSVAFLLHRGNLKISAVAAVLLLIPGYGLARWILPHVDEPGLKIPVIAYTVVISTMLALATGCLKRPGGGWMVAGALLFYLSDICVARGAFVAPGPLNSRIGLPLYFGGQLLLAISIAYAQRHAASRNATAQSA